MSDILDRELRDLFANGPRTAPAAVVDDAISQASTVAQLRPRFARLDRRAWPPQARSIADPGVYRALRLVLIALLVILSAAVVLAIGSRLTSHPSLVPAGELPSAIRGPLALALPDGRILVQGQGPGVIFDPLTGTSVPANLGPSQDARLLPDGRVIVIGAEASTSTGSTSVGIFDPDTRRTTVIGEIPNLHFPETSTVLDDGRVLFVGGADTSGGGFLTLATVRVFDPATGVLTDLAPMLDPRVRASVVALDLGRVLIVGSGDATAGSSAVGVELYDAAGGGRSEAIGTVNRSPAFWPGPSVRLSDGRVLISGSQIVDRRCGDEADPHGLQYLEGHQEMHLFDPKTGRLTQLADIPHGSGYAVPTADGRVVLFGSYLVFPGGCLSAVPPIRQPWIGIYDPATGITLETNDPTTGAATLPFTITHDYADGVLLPDGRVALIADDEGAIRNAVDLLTLGR